MERMETTLKENLTREEVREVAFGAFLVGCATGSDVLAHAAGRDNSQLLRIARQVFDDEWDAIIAKATRSATDATPLGASAEHPTGTLDSLEREA